MIFLGYHSNSNPECKRERGFINQLYIKLGSLLLFSQGKVAPVRRRTGNKMSAHEGVPRFQGPIYHQEKNMWVLKKKNIIHSLLRAVLKCG